jgi:hypothetical protein
MNKTQLLTFAIMTVNDSNKRDYYDNFSLLSRKLYELAVRILYLQTN